MPSSAIRAITSGSRTNPGAAGMKPAAVAAALDELLRRDLVRSTDLPRSFRFRHPQLDGIFPREVRRLRLQIKATGALLGQRGQGPEVDG